MTEKKIRLQGLKTKKKKETYQVWKKILKKIVISYAKKGSESKG